MSEPTEQADDPAQTGRAPLSGQVFTAVPRWVKVFIIIGVVLAATLVVMLATGHGPGRHTGAAPGQPLVQVQLAIDRL